jgi:Flp pilus assembly protein TadD
MELNPDDWETMARIGHIHELEGDYNSAVGWYKRAIEKAPLEIAPRRDLAVLYDRHDMFDEATAEYESVLAIDPYHMEALLSVGNLCLQNGEYRRAVTAFKRALLLDGDGKRGWNCLGAAYEGIGDSERAEQAYRQSLSRDPDDEEANCGFARSKYQRRRSDLTESERSDLIRRLDTVLSVNPYNEKAEVLRKMLDGQSDRR